MTARSHTRLHRRESRRLRAFAADRAKRKPTEEPRHDPTEWLPPPAGYGAWCRNESARLRVQDIRA